MSTGGTVLAAISRPPTSSTCRRAATARLGPTEPRRLRRRRQAHGPGGAARQRRHADRINEAARRLVEPWLARYGGTISSAWLFSMALQILDEAPHVYQRAERLIEAADWIVWQLNGVETRNACTAGYKAMHQDRDFPRREYFAALHPDFADVVDEKMSRELLPLGAKAGGLSAEAALWTGLAPGTPVAVAIDAHMTLPVAGTVEPGTLVMIMGTSTCSVLVDAELGGLLIGMTLATRPSDIYRALLEATAYGLRVIIDGFERGGVPVTQHFRS